MSWPRGAQPPAPMGVFSGFRPTTSGVFLVDDHPVMRRGIAAMMEEFGWEVVGQAGSFAEAQETMRNVHWSLAILDVHLPDGNGCDLLTWLRTQGVRTPVLMYSALPDDTIAGRVFKLGGNGFINKGAQPAEFQAATRKVADGGRYVSPEFAEVLAESLASGPALHDTLSDREREVMLLIAEGKTPGQVAAALNIQVNTISTYRARILKKLNLNNSMDIVQYALRNKLVLF
jgi:two-component system, NarL family, invasion response regulator UvrY